MAEMTGADWGRVFADVFKDFSFSGKGGGKPDWKSIEKLMTLDAEQNRTDRHGMFSNWDWTQDEEGRWTQTNTPASGFGAGKEYLKDRMEGGGFSDFNSPEQFNSIQDAAMADEMDRRGILSQMPDLERAFGLNSGEQYDNPDSFMDNKDYSQYSDVGTTGNPMYETDEFTSQNLADDAGVGVAGEGGRSNREAFDRMADGLQMDDIQRGNLWNEHGISTDWGQFDLGSMEGLQKAAQWIGGLGAGFITGNYPVGKAAYDQIGKWWPDPRNQPVGDVRDGRSGWGNNNLTNPTNFDPQNQYPNDFVGDYSADQDGSLEFGYDYIRNNPSRELTPTERIDASRRTYDGSGGGGSYGGNSMFSAGGRNRGSRIDRSKIGTSKRT